MHFFLIKINNFEIIVEVYSIKLTIKFVKNNLEEILIKFLIILL
jgi:hypothetical protein